MTDKTKEVQKYCLEELKVFADVCNAYGLKYFMIGGTLLGAIRHKGFIPWDDDVDIAMPRKDYEKLISIADSAFKEPFYLDHYSKSNNSVVLRNMIAVLKNKDTKMDILHNGNIEHTQVIIDILPIDGTPNNALLRKIHYGKLLANRALLKFACIDNIDLNESRPFIENFLILFARLFKIGKLINAKKQLIKLDNLLKKYDMDNSNICGTFLGAYKTREFVDKKFFMERQEYLFEDKLFYATKFYNEYLIHMYGNYMQLPRERDRVGKHKILSINEINQNPV